MSLSLPKAQLVGVFLELLSYGVYIMIFLQCMQVLQRRRYRPSDYLLGTAVSLFVLITAHLVVDIIRTLDAFTSNMDIPNYPVDYYGSLVTWQNISRNALYVATTVVSDAFILYRTFQVWGRSYLVIVIPFMLFLVDIATGIFWVYTIKLVLPGETVFVNFLVERIIIFYGITLAMNFLCTCLIAYKIWTIQRSVAPFFKGNGNVNELSRLAAIVVESGAVYSAVLVGMIASYSLNSTAMFVLRNPLTPIIGIVFSAVIVRVGSGRSLADTRATTTGNHTQWAVRLNLQQTTSDHLAPPTGFGPFSDRSIQVAMSHTVHTHADGFPEEEVRKDVEADAKTQGSDVVDMA